MSAPSEQTLAAQKEGNPDTPPPRESLGNVRESGPQPMNQSPLRYILLSCPIHEVIDLFNVDFIPERFRVDTFPPWF